jgi:hypothetical protein
MSPLRGLNSQSILIQGLAGLATRLDPSGVPFCFARLSRGWHRHSSGGTLPFDSTCSDKCRCRLRQEVSRIASGASHTDNRSWGACEMAELTPNDCRCYPLPMKLGGTDTCPGGFFHSIRLVRTSVGVARDKRLTGLPRVLCTPTIVRGERAI